MRLLNSLIVAVLLSSVVLSVVPPLYSVEGIDPNVSCLKIIDSGGVNVLENNCSYDFRIISNGEDLGVLKKGESLSPGFFASGRVNVSDFYLMSGGEEVKVIVVNKNRTTSWSEELGGLYLLTTIILVSGFLITFKFLGKKKKLTR